MSLHRKTHFHKLGVELLEDRRLLSVGSPQLELFQSSPALFVENRGQWPDPTIRYLHQGDGANVAMTDFGPVFQVFRPDESPFASSDQLPPSLVEFSVAFAGAKPIVPRGLEPADTKFNFFTSATSDPHTNVPGFATVAYEDLYVGIDMISRGRRDSLKYEFHVAPGADHRQIRIQYSGIEGLSLADDGTLQVDLGGDWGILTDDAPFLYQMIDGRQTAVEGKFRLLDSRTYGFEVIGEFDAGLELVIDPNLAWSSYLGGTSSDYGNGMAVDASDNAYVAGYTASRAFSGAINTYKGGDFDAFVAKVGSDGTLAWTTYLGGKAADTCHGIAVDNDGNVLVIGETSSTDFSGAINKYKGGPTDAFVAKLSPAGAVLWATFVGGTKEDCARGIVLDGVGNAHIAGQTWSTSNFGQINNTFKGGAFDAFVAEVSAAGATAWATYLGGNGNDVAYAISLDASGIAYLTGSTMSSDLFNANNTMRGGAYDAFVAKIAVDGTQDWATYLGGTVEDVGYGIVTDDAGNSYVTGSTSSNDFTGVSNTYKGGFFDAFVAKVSAAGSQTWATYLGGSGSDIGYGIIVDDLGVAFVVGTTASVNFAGANNAYEGGTGDAFIAKIAAAGTQAWATYVGGNYDDIARRIYIDAGGNTFIAGQTTSTNLANANNQYHGSLDAFVAKINDRSQTPATPDLIDLCDSGAKPDDNITNLDNSDSTKALQFLVRNTSFGATVTLYIDGIVAATVVADAVSMTMTTDGKTDLADRVHLITVKQVEPGQPESTLSAALTITIDTVAPDQPSPPDLASASDTGVSATDNLTNDTTPTFAISATPYYRFYRDDSCISLQYEKDATFTTGTQTDGTYSYSVATVDEAGNVSVRSNALSVILNTVRPTVTIERAAEQSNPTRSTPVKFNVQFSKPAYGFATGDATISGTAGATDATIFGSGTVYYVSASGMKSNGSVIVSIPDSAAQDAAGNASTASTGRNNSVTYIAMERVWDGGGADGKWTTAANWVGDIAPSPGDNLLFPEDALRKENTNDYPPGTAFASTTVLGSGYRFLASIKSATIEVLDNSTLTVSSIVCDTLSIGGAMPAKQPFVWDGGGSDNLWTTAANWVGDRVPYPGDELIFPAGAARLENVNNYPASVVFGSITILGDAYRFQMDSIRASGTVEVKGDSTITVGSIVCDTLTIGSPKKMMIWDGGGTDNKWTTAANWVGDSAPKAGDDLVFPDGAARPECVNDFPAGVVFGSITILGDAYRFQMDSIRASGTIEVKGNSTITVGSIVCDTLTIGSPSGSASSDSAPAVVKEIAPVETNSDASRVVESPTMTASGASAEESHRQDIQSPSLSLESLPISCVIAAEKVVEPIDLQKNEPLLVRQVLSKPIHKDIFDCLTVLHQTHQKTAPENIHSLGESLQRPFVVPPLGGNPRVLPPKGGTTNNDAVLLHSLALQAFLADIEQFADTEQEKSDILDELLNGLA
jgi:hypothetical protein